MCKITIMKNAKRKKPAISRFYQITEQTAYLGQSLGHHF